MEKSYHMECYTFFLNFVIIEFVNSEKKEEYLISNSVGDI